MDSHDAKRFLQNYWLPVIQRMIDQQLDFIALFLIGQSIEFLGAFLDNKPFKARQQSKIRFRNSLFKLFPAKYARANKGDWLYDQLRSQMSHVLIPGQSIVLIPEGEKAQHFRFEDQHLKLSVHQFYADLEHAVASVFTRIEQGKLKDKKLGGFSIDNLKLPEGF